MAEEAPAVTAEVVGVEHTPPHPGVVESSVGPDPEATITLSSVSMALDRFWLMEVGTGLWHRVESLPCDMGRGEGVELCLSGDRTVSRRHARLHRRPGGIVIEDLGSTSGIRVNGHPVQEVLLAHQDVVTLGATTLIVHFGTPPSEAAPDRAIGRPGGRPDRKRLGMIASLFLLLALGGIFLFRLAPPIPGGQAEGVPEASGRGEAGEVAGREATHTGESDLADGRVNVPTVPAAQSVQVVSSSDSPAGRSAQTASVTAKRETPRPPAPPPVKVTLLDGEQRIDRARKRYLAGDVQGAQRLLEEMIDSNRYSSTDRGRARHVLRDLRRLAAAYRSGLASWDAGRSEEGFDAWVRFLRAEGRIFPGQRSRWAEEVREKVVQELSRRGREAAEAGRQHDAYRYWQQAERIDPGSEGARLLAEREREAQALYRQGYRQETVDLRRALEYWKRVVGLVPPDSEYHIKAAAKIRWYAYLEE